MSDAIVRLGIWLAFLTFVSSSNPSWAVATQSQPSGGAGISNQTAPVAAEAPLPGMPAVLDSHRSFSKILSLRDSRRILVAAGLWFCTKMKLKLEIPAKNRFDHLR
jgi:hypothetical protein